MTIKQIFDKITAESSKNSKIEILRKYSDNELLKRVLYMANSPRIKFYIKQIPEYTFLWKITGRDNSTILDLQYALSSLDEIINRKLTGQKAIDHLISLLERLSEDDAYVLERIIDKNCKIKMGAKSINKVFLDLIEITPYMGALSFSIKLIKKLFQKAKEVVSQVKMDGRYCNTIINGGFVEPESRQGEPTIFSYTPKFMKDLELFGDCVLNGELTIPEILRYESNGIIASLISIGKKFEKGENIDKEIEKFEKKHKIIYESALDSIVYTIWDTITYEEFLAKKSLTPYRQRLMKLGDLFLKGYENDVNSISIGREANTANRIIEGRIVTTYEEAMKHFSEMLNLGEEGTILKDFDGIWTDGKPSHQIKCKLEIEVDLEIIEFNYGDEFSKNVDVISSLTCQTSDGLLKTRVQGLMESDMEYITANQKELLGTIVKCKSSGISQNKKGEYSFLHPAYRGSRIGEKDIADSLEEVKQIENMAKGLKSGLDS